MGDKSTPPLPSNNNSSPNPQPSPQEGLQPIIELSDELEAECASLLPPASAPGTQDDSLPSDPLHTMASPLRDQRRSRRGKKGGEALGTPQMSSGGPPLPTIDASTTAADSEPPDSAGSSLTNKEPGINSNLEMSTISLPEFSATSMTATVPTPSLGSTEARGLAACTETEVDDDSMCISTSTVFETNSGQHRGASDGTGRHQFPPNREPVMEYVEPSRPGHTGLKDGRIGESGSTLTEDLSSGSEYVPPLSTLGLPRLPTSPRGSNVPGLTHLDPLAAGRSSQTEQPGDLLTPKLKLHNDNDLPFKSFFDLPTHALIDLVKRTSDLATLELEHFIIYLCSGAVEMRDGSLTTQCLRHDVRVVAVDPLVHPTLSLIASDIVAALARLAAHESCAGVLATPLCRTFSPATHAGGDGPDPYRDLLRPDGIPSTSGNLPTRVLHDNYIAESCLSIGDCSCNHGGFVWIENPPGRHLGSEFPIEGREMHAPIWLLSAMRAWIAKTRAGSIIFDRCCIDTTAQKKTQFVVTPNIEPLVRASFGQLLCSTAHPAHAHDPLLGRLADSTFRSAKAESFGPALNARIASVVRTFIDTVYNSRKTVAPVLAVIHPTPDAVTTDGRAHCDPDNKSPASMSPSLSRPPTPPSLAEQPEQDLPAHLRQYLGPDPQRRPQHDARSVSSSGKIAVFILSADLTTVLALAYFGPTSTVRDVFDSLVSRLGLGDADTHYLRHQYRTRDNLELLLSSLPPDDEGMVAFTLHRRVAGVVLAAQTQRLIRATADTAWLQRSELSSEPPPLPLPQLPPHSANLLSGRSPAQWQLRLTFETGANDKKSCPSGHEWEDLVTRAIRLIPEGLQDSDWMCIGKDVGHVLHLLCRGLAFGDPYMPSDLWSDMAYVRMQSRASDTINRARLEETERPTANALLSWQTSDVPPRRIATGMLYAIVSVEQDDSAVFDWTAPLVLLYNKPDTPGQLIQRLNLNRRSVESAWPVGTHFASHCLTTYLGRELHPLEPVYHRLCHGDEKRTLLTREGKEVTLLRLRPRPPGPVLGPLRDYLTQTHGDGHLAEAADVDVTSASLPSSWQIQVTQPVCTRYQHTVQLALRSSLAPLHVMPIISGPRSISCDTPLSPLSFEMIQLQDPEGRLVEVAELPVLGDTCASVTICSAAFANDLRRINASSVIVIQDGPLASSITGVASDATCILEEIITIRGLHLDGVHIPPLERVSVVRCLPYGLILGNSFNVEMGARYDYGRRVVEFLSPACQGASARFSITGDSDLRVCIVASTATPVAYTPETIQVEPRCVTKVRVRVPAQTPVGSTLLMSPLVDSRKDIGVIVSHGLCKVNDDGYVYVELINPKFVKVVVPLMTPLAHFEVDPTIEPLKPEFSVEEVMAAINLGPELTDEQRGLIRDMLASRLVVFASKPRYAQGVKCHIHTPQIDSGAASPPQARSSRLGPSQEEALRRIIDEQVEAGYLARTSSDYNSRLLLVKKPPTGNGQDDWRLVLDFRALNELTVGDRYPLPSIASNLDRVGQAKWLSCLDLLAGFHQIEICIDDGSAQKTAFQTPWGQYMYVRMPMGLKSAPATFCRVVAAIFQGLPPGVAIDYVDDVATATNGTFEDHVRDLGLVFDRLIESGFTVKAKKVYLGFREIPWLGFLVGVNGIRPDPLKTKPIRDITLDALVSDASLPARFVGLLQFYSRFIPNFANVAAVFYDLRSAKGRAAREEVCRSQRAKTAFYMLQRAIEECVVLARPDWSRPFILCTDASAYGAGAVLAQVDDSGFERPLAFFSHRFSSDERAGAVVDREGLALHSAVRHFRPYLLGSRFDVYTDHGALVYLMSHQHAESSKRQRWAAELQGYSEMTIHHRPGKDPNMTPADAISRLFDLLAITAPGSGSSRPSSMPDTPLSGPIGATAAAAAADAEAAVENELTAESAIDRAQLRDVDGATPPRSFMVNADTLPSTADVSLPIPDDVAEILSSLSPEVKAAHAERIVASISATEAGEKVGRGSTAQACATPPVANGAKSGAESKAGTTTTTATAVNPVNAKSKDRVGIVFTDGLSVLLWQKENGILGFIAGASGGDSTKTYRDLALLHVAATLGDLNPPTLAAIRNATYSTKCGDTLFYVAVLKQGDEPRVQRQPLAWIHPDIGRVTPTPEGSLVWQSIPSLVDPSAGLDTRADSEMARRLSLAAKGEGIATRLIELLLTASGPTNEKAVRQPSTSSRNLSAKDNATGALDPRGPGLHDSPVTGSVALNQLTADIGADPMRVLALDLEGQLRAVNGNIEFAQAAAFAPGCKVCVHVFDIRADDSPLTGAGYDRDGQPRSLRSLLEDGTIVKILHCCGGDSSALFHIYGITLRNVYDTSVGDCLCLGSGLGKPRSLLKVIRHWCGEDVSMEHKETIQHSVALWAGRPMEPHLFQYSYEDVIHLRTVYLEQLRCLEQLNYRELASDVSTHMCPPLVLSCSHPLWPTPTRIAIVAHDHTTVICLTDSKNSNAYFPNVPTPAHVAPTGWLAVARAAWAELAGAPVKGLAAIINLRLRKPVYVGDTLLFELRIESINDNLLDLLKRSLALKAVAEPRVKDRHIAFRRLSDTFPEAWERICIQYIRYQSQVINAKLVVEAAVSPVPQPVSPAVVLAISAGVSTDMAGAVWPGAQRVAILINDGTIGLFVFSSRDNRTTLVSGLLDESQPLASTLRAVETCLGPVLDYSSFPELTNGILTAVEDAKVLILSRFSTLVVYINFSTSYLQAARAAFNTAFAMRRSTQTLQANVSSLRWCELENYGDTAASELMTAAVSERERAWLPNKTDKSIVHGVPVLSIWAGADWRAVRREASLPRCRAADYGTVARVGLPLSGSAFGHTHPVPRPPDLSLSTRGNMSTSDGPSLTPPPSAPPSPTPPSIEWSVGQPEELFSLVVDAEAGFWQHDLRDEQPLTTRDPAEHDPAHELRPDDGVAHSSLPPVPLRMERDDSPAGAEPDNSPRHNPRMEPCAKDVLGGRSSPLAMHIPSAAHPSEPSPLFTAPSDQAPSHGLRAAPPLRSGTFGHGISRSRYPPIRPFGIGRPLRPLRRSSHSCAATSEHPEPSPGDAPDTATSQPTGAVDTPLSCCSAALGSWAGRPVVASSPAVSTADAVTATSTAIAHGAEAAILELQRGWEPPPASPANSDDVEDEVFPSSPDSDSSSLGDPQQPSPPCSPSPERSESAHHGLTNNLNSHVSMDANALEHGDAANGAGPRTPFAESKTADSASSTANPVECAGDAMSVIAPAARLNASTGLQESIGEGLFATCDIAIGTIVAAFGEGMYVRRGDWPIYCKARGLPAEWAGFLTMHTLPPPTKAKAAVMYCDRTWTDMLHRPQWSYLNHSTTPNVTAQRDKQGTSVTWRAHLPITAGEELTFHYGSDCRDWDDQRHLSGSLKRTRSGAIATAGPSLSPPDMVPPPSAPPSPSSANGPRPPATASSTSNSWWPLLNPIHMFGSAWMLDVGVSLPERRPCRPSVSRLLSFSPPLSSRSSSTTPDQQLTQRNATPVPSIMDRDQPVMPASRPMDESCREVTCSLESIPTQMHVACGRRWSIAEIAWALNVLRAPFTLLATMLISSDNATPTSVLDWATAWAARTSPAESMCRRFLECPAAFELFQDAPPLESDRMLACALVILSPRESVVIGCDFTATVRDIAGLRCVAELIHQRVRADGQAQDYGRIVQQWGYHSRRRFAARGDPLEGLSSSSALPQEVITYTSSGAPNSTSPLEPRQRPQLVLVVQGDRITRTQQTTGRFPFRLPALLLQRPPLVRFLPRLRGQIILQEAVLEHYRSVRFHRITDFRVVHYTTAPWTPSENLRDAMEGALFLGPGLIDSQRGHQMQADQTGTLPSERLVTAVDRINVGLQKHRHWGVLWDGKGALIVQWAYDLHVSRLHLVCASGDDVGFALFGPYPDHGGSGSSMDVFDCYELQQALLSGRYRVGDDLYFECRWPDETIEDLKAQFSPGTPERHACVQEAARCSDMNCRRYTRIVPSLVPPQWARHYPTSILVQPEPETRRLTLAQLATRDAVHPIPRALPDTSSDLARVTVSSTLTSFGEHHDTLVATDPEYPFVPTQVIAYVLRIALQWYRTPTGWMSSTNILSALPPPPPSLPPSAPGSSVGDNEVDNDGVGDPVIDVPGPADNAADDMVWELPLELFLGPPHPLRQRTRTAMVVLAEAAFDENPGLFPHMGGKVRGRATAFVDDATGEELARGDLGRVSLFIRIHAMSNAGVQGSDHLGAALAEARACFAALLASGGDTSLAPSYSSCVFEVALLIMADFILAHDLAIRNTPGILDSSTRADALKLRADLRAAPPDAPPSPPACEIIDSALSRSSVDIIWQGLRDLCGLSVTYPPASPPTSPPPSPPASPLPEVASARCAAKVWFAALDSQSRPQLLSFIRSDSAVTRPQFDTFGGKMEPRDAECFARCGIREVTEEATLDPVWRAAMLNILEQAPQGQRVMLLQKSNGTLYRLAIWVVVLPTSALQHLPTPTTEGIREMRPTTLAWYTADVVLSNLACFRFAEPLEAALRDLLLCNGLPVASLNWGPPPLVNGDSRSESMPAPFDLTTPSTGRCLRREYQSAPTELPPFSDGGESGEGGHAIAAPCRASPLQPAQPVARDLTNCFNVIAPDNAGSVVRVFCFRWELGRFKLHLMDRDFIPHSFLQQGELANDVACRLLREQLALALPVSRLLEVWIAEDAQIRENVLHDFAVILTHTEADQICVGKWATVDDEGPVASDSDLLAEASCDPQLTDLRAGIKIALTTVQSCMSQDESASEYSLAEPRIEPCAKDAHANTAVPAQVASGDSEDTASECSLSPSANAPLLASRALTMIRLEATRIIQRSVRTWIQLRRPGMESCAKDVTSTPTARHPSSLRTTFRQQLSFQWQLNHLAAHIIQSARLRVPRLLSKSQLRPVLAVGIQAQQRRGAAMAIQSAIRSFLQHRRHNRKYASTPRSPNVRPDHRPSEVPPSEAIGSAGRPPLQAPPSVESLIAAQKIDSSVAHIYAFIHDPTAFGMDETISSKDKKKTKERAEKYLLSGGLLYYRDISSAQTVDEFDADGPARIYLPEKFRNKVVGFYHENGGHFGVQKTQDLVTRLYYWPRMRLTVRRYVKKCHVCARVKAPPQLAGQSIRVENGRRPWDVVTIDLYTYQRIDGYDHVLVMADGFTRGVEVVACVGVPSSQQVIDCIKFRILRGHRTTPLIIRSDHGSIFVSELITQFFAAYHITLRAGSPEHHSTAGLAERFNSVMRDFLITHRLSSGDRRWYDYISDLELMYNLTTHSFYGQSPTFVEFGHDGRMPWDLIFGDPSSLAPPPSAVTVRASVTRLHNVWDFRRQQLGLNALAVKRAGDLHKDTTVKFQVHDRVLLRRLPGHPKWIEPYHGPYRIAEVKENDNYRLRDLGSQRLVDFAHVSRLVAYPDVTNHGDVTPAPDEYFVHRILARRPDTTGGYQYKVRWRGYGPSEDRWLDLEELANCYEMVQAFNSQTDPLPNPPPAPTLEDSLDDQPAEALSRSPRTRYFRVRPEGDEAAPASAAPDSELEEENGADTPNSHPSTSSPNIAADGTIAQGLYVISDILDVQRPGLPPRLNVLVQAEGVDLSTGLPWPPEWIPISRLSADLRRQARQMELERYDLPEVISSQQETASNLTLEAWQDPAAHVIIRFLRHVTSMLTTPPPVARGKLHADGPIAALKVRSAIYLRVRRDDRWSWTELKDLSMPERRRARTFGKLCHTDTALLDLLASGEA